MENASLQVSQLLLLFYHILICYVNKNDFANPTAGKIFVRKCNFPADFEKPQEKKGYWAGNVEYYDHRKSLRRDKASVRGARNKRAI